MIDKCIFTTNLMCTLSIIASYHCGRSWSPPAVLSETQSLQLPQFHVKHDSKYPSCISVGCTLQTFSCSPCSAVREMYRRYCRPEELLRADLAISCLRRRARWRGQRKCVSSLALYDIYYTMYYLRFIKTNMEYNSWLTLEMNCEIDLHHRGTYIYIWYS